MRKQSFIILSLVVTMLSLANVRVSAVPVQIDLQSGYIDPQNEQDEPSRGPVQPPIIYIEDGTLTFVTPCDGSVLRLLDEDGYVVYSTVIPTGTTTLPLPTTLSGEYELQIIQDGWCFYGWIEL